jgi:hypothetical protein
MAEAPKNSPKAIEIAIENSLFMIFPLFHLEPIVASFIQGRCLTETEQGSALDKDA